MQGREASGAAAGPSTAALIQPVVDSFMAKQKHWDALLSVADELLDLTLNYRQSGHPGGSRSKMHILLTTMLSGAMRWDILHPWRPLQDRFVLSAGHCVPAVYSSLAVLNEVLRARQALDGDNRFSFPDNGRWALTGQDLSTLRRKGGLPGHAEMAGKTLFLKFNTGPSGHGMPAAAGEALALKQAGASDVNVFCLEGEGGLSPGSAHETRNTAWGLGLSNLFFLIDWNDFGIDARSYSSVVAGGPYEWFAPSGWRVVGTEHGMDWEPTASTLLEAVYGDNPDNSPTVAWFRTRKGRGYGKLDASSHGTPWPQNSPEFWAGRARFAEQFGITYTGFGLPASDDPTERRLQVEANIQAALDVLRSDTELVTEVSDLLIDLADRVPREITDSPMGRPENIGVFSDPAIFEPRRYPQELWKRPGQAASNRSALTAWAAYVNAYSAHSYGRPLFLACSADLAASTGVLGFANDSGDLPGAGWYERSTRPEGTVLPQQITEFTNASLMAGLTTVNFAADPLSEFDGFWGACSTYGAFTYLVYGPLRLFSQLAQDSPLRVGKVLYIAGHSGPETAEDSRTHFGIFEPGIMQLFPGDQALDLHPWEYNEVPVVLAAALRLDVHVVTLNLTRPAVTIPDRVALGIDSHWEAARGAYLINEASRPTPADGTLVVRGTVTTANVVSLLPELRRRGYDLKIVAAISWGLFQRQDPAYRDKVLSARDRQDAMIITNGALRWMAEWSEGALTTEFALSPESDGRWLSGGDLDEVMAEAGLSPHHILAGIERYVAARRRTHPSV